jgi:hypothetical protein
VHRDIRSVHENKVFEFIYLHSFSLISKTSRVKSPINNKHFGISATDVLPGFEPLIFGLTLQYTIDVTTRHIISIGMCTAFSKLQNVKKSSDDIWVMVCSIFTVWTSNFIDWLWIQPHYVYMPFKLFERNSICSLTTVTTYNIISV